MMNEFAQLEKSTGSEGIAHEDGEEEKESIGRRIESSHPIHD